MTELSGFSVSAMKNMHLTFAFNHNRTGCLRLVAALILGALLIWLGLVSMGALLVITDPLVKTDGVAILSGGGIERYEEGARIYKEKLAKYYILTETGETVPKYGGSYTAELKQQVIDLGIPEGAIMVTEQHASSTLEEAGALKKLLRSVNFKTCTVVTDPYHTFRTRLIFQRVFKNSGITIYVRPVRGHWYHSNTWFLSITGIQATLSEYSKLAGFLLGINRF
jgi:uncharacterized SAM-binding protein YcdF (DUF218 family)